MLSASRQWLTSFDLEHPKPRGRNQRALSGDLLNHWRLLWFDRSLRFDGPHVLCLAHLFFDLYRSSV